METLEPVVPEAKSKSTVTPYRIYQTTDYEMFKIMTGNRRPNQAHLRRLKDSMQKSHLFCPILVNDKFQIIDGQHRFFSSKELGLPIYYIVIPGYGLPEIQILNTNNSNWKKVDYLKSYCDLKNYEYVKFRKFMQDFPEFGIQSSIKICTLSTAKGGNKKVDGKNIHIRTFEDGDLVLPNVKKSYEMAEQIKEFKPFYEGYHRSSFVSAIVKLLSHPKYKHEEMIRKIEQQPTSLKHCTNVAQYKYLLEEIYNYKRTNKINLRYGYSKKDE